MRKLNVCVWAIALGAAFALAHPATAQEADAKAKENYVKYCRKCHGEEGKGDGPGAAILNPRPRNFSDCALLKKRSDDELFKVVNEGGDSVGLSSDMQAWGGTLKEDEIRTLIKFVRAFCKE